MYDIPTIETYTIIRIINKSWVQSFARIASNKKAIANRGWYSYNCALIVIPQIRSSITNKERELESFHTRSIILLIQTRESIIDLAHDEPTFDPTFLSQPSSSSATTSNFTSDVAAWCFDTIVNDHDLNTARRPIKKNRDEGKSLKEKLIESKKNTGDSLFKAGSCQFGKTIFDLHKNRATKTRQDEIDTATKSKETYLAAKLAISSVVAVQPDPNKWNIVQLKIMLEPLKMKEDGAIPTLKVKILEAYHLWKERTESIFDTVVAEKNMGDMGAHGMIVLLNE